MFHQKSPTQGMFYQKGPTEEMFYQKVMWYMTISLRIFKIWHAYVLICDWSRLTYVKGEGSMPCFSILQWEMFHASYPDQQLS